MRVKASFGRIKLVGQGVGQGAKPLDVSYMLMVYYVMSDIYMQRR